MPRLGYKDIREALLMQFYHGIECELWDTAEERFYDLNDHALFFDSCPISDIDFKRDCFIKQGSLHLLEPSNSDENGNWVFDGENWINEISYQSAPRQTIKTTLRNNKPFIQPREIEV